LEGGLTGRTRNVVSGSSAKRRTLLGRLGGGEEENLERNILRREKGAAKRDVGVSETLTPLEVGRTGLTGLRGPMSDKNRK